jgi:small-conductance mechanosensitive channel
MEIFREIAKVFHGICWGLIILFLGYFCYAFSMVGKNGGPFSKRKKTFAFLAAFIILGLSVWLLYAGVTAHDKFRFTIGLFTAILGIAMPSTIPLLNSSVELCSSTDNPLDYGD